MAQKVSDNKNVFPATEFVSSGATGHINWIFTRLWTHSVASPMVPKQMDGTNHFISHLWNTRSSIWESCENFSEVMRREFWEFHSNIRLYSITSLKKFCHKPSDKKPKQKKNNRNRQIDKKGYISMSILYRRASKEENKMSF